jgi:hypothetical protein
MENPYRKLFNLFALSVLAFSVYINFLHKEEEPGIPKKIKPASEQATMISKFKPLSLENTKTLLAKEEKKN